MLRRLQQDAKAASTNVDDQFLADSQHLQDMKDRLEGLDMFFLQQ